MPHSAKRIAALVASAGQAPDPLVRDFVGTLKADGIRVRGLLQQLCEGDAGCKFSLVDIDTGRRYPISQNLGSASMSCMLDPGGLADATAVMRTIAAEGADLVIFNRFSGLEAEGEGFAAEMLDLMSRDLPVLTIVRDIHLAAWRRFTGGLACELPADAGALRDWFATIPPASQ